jgi:hypothetical protein
LDNLLALDLLEGEDLVELALQLLDESVLVVIGPYVLGGGSESVFEVVVVDVVPFPFLYQRRLELVTESVVGW